MMANNYSTHMHPITKLAVPDFMDQDKGSMIDTSCVVLYAAVPLAMNVILNSASIYLNLYFVGLDQGTDIFNQVCFGTVISSILVYNTIEYIGTAFSIICTYFSDK